MRIPASATQAIEFAYRTTTERGYGWEHQQRRAKLLEKVKGAKCPHCGKALTAKNADAAHGTPLKSKSSGLASHMECATCNRSEGGRLRHGMARKRQGE